MNRPMAIVKDLIIVCIIAAVTMWVSPGWAAERTVDDWIAALKDDDSRVRVEAAQALGQMKNSYALEPLTEALRDDVPEVRATAASALGSIGDQYSVEPLIPMLRDEDPSVRRESAAALSTITGQDFGEEPGRWQEWWEENQDLGGGY